MRHSSLAVLLKALYSEASPLDLGRLRHLASLQTCSLVGGVSHEDVAVDVENELLGGAGEGEAMKREAAWSL